MSLKALGVQVLHVSNHRPALSEVHPHMRPIQSEVFYLQSITPDRWFAALVWAIRTFGKRIKKVIAAVRESEEDGLQCFKHIAGAVALLHHLRGQKVHLHAHFTYGAAAVVRWANLLADVPYSLTLHGSDILFDDPPDLGEKLSNASALVSISQKNFHAIDAQFPSLVHARRTVIPLGIEAGTFRPPRPIALPLRILNVGRLSVHKAQHVLISACAQLKSEHVPFICDIIGSGECESSLREQINSLGLGDAVHLLGARYHDEVLSLYQQYHVFVLTSIVEGMPIVLMEAMNAGIPIVTTNVGGIPELVGKSAILVPPGSPAAIAGALLCIAHGKVDILEMTNAAHARVCEYFNMHLNHAHFAEFLKDLPSESIQ